MTFNAAVKMEPMKRSCSNGDAGKLAGQGAAVERAHISVPAATRTSFQLTPAGRWAGYDGRPQNAKMIRAKRKRDANASKATANERACSLDRPGKFLLKPSQYRRHLEEFGGG